MITADSRKVQPGCLFVAIAGGSHDGHAFIDEAILRGCVAVIAEKGRLEAIRPDSPDVCVLEVEDSKAAYAEVAAAYYGHPASRLKLIGITGTNGKTTVTYLLEEVLTSMGIPVGVIGTVNYRYTVGGVKRVLPSPFTTPEAMQLQWLLREMADAGVVYVIMEVSSHALAQSRIGDTQFDVVAFTNLTRDHLDYHPDMQDYFLAKTTLFSQHLKEGGVAVVTSAVRNADEGDWAAVLEGICRGRGIKTLICGIQQEADIRLIDTASDLLHSRIRLATRNGDHTLHSPLVGRFNVDNIMTALAVSSALGLPEAEVRPLLARASGAPGRLQRVTVEGVDAQEKPVVFVDYAHTPDALQKVLAALAALPHRELYCLFGCGGDRDTGKRPVMGSIAAELSDVVVVTDDNPRSEPPETITAQVVAGIAGTGMPCRPVDWLTERARGEKGCVVIDRREEAIAAVIRAAGRDDIVLIAGKGHENYQLVRGKKRFFDDCLEARAALSAWTIEAIVEATGGIGPEGHPCGLLGRVSTDSRNVEPGEIFVALEGDRFDGHDFIGQVADKGAGCLVVMRRIEERYAGHVPQVIVPDTQRALGDMAGYRRRLMRRLSAPVVIGLTGSCGKTTVKEMTAAILQRHWPAGPDNPENCVLKTVGNYNNLIGMPLSLLPLGVKHRAAVMEMGMNRPGELARLAEIAAPDISCITNIYAAHLEGLHSIAGVARAKEELFAGTAPDGILVVNLDDPLVRDCAGKYPQKKITFSVLDAGHQYGPDLRATDVKVDTAGTIAFRLHLPGSAVDIRLTAAGAHNVANAVTAAAIAWAAGAGPAAIAAGLGDFRAAAKRMEMLESADGFGILNDTYNANPASMAAALRTLEQMQAGVTVAVLGDMLELGESSESAHRDLGRLAARCRVDYLGLVGDYAGLVAEGARDAGLATERIKVFADKEQAAAWIEDLTGEGRLGRGDWLLVKASRGLRMETIVARLTGKT
jgi:murE/murF fusion protein